jgi:cell shape-determining protein MreD
MKWLIYILFTALIIVVEQGLFRTLYLGAFAPDLFLLLTLATLWSSNNFDYLLFAVLGGIWMELVLGLPIGSLSFGLIIVGTTTYLILNRWLFSEKPWQYFLLAVVLGTIGTNLWLWVYVNILNVFMWSQFQISFALIYHRIFYALILNIILIYPIYAIIELIARYLQTSSKNRIKL